MHQCVIRLARPGFAVVASIWPPPSRPQNQALSLRLTELQQLVDDYELQREVRV